MTVLKSFLLTFLLILLFSITQIGFGFLILKTDLIPQNLNYHYGITLIISFVIAYLTIFSIFWKPAIKFNHMFHFKGFNFKIITYLLVIIIGLQLVGRPF